MVIDEVVKECGDKYTKDEIRGFVFWILNPHNSDSPDIRYAKGNLFFDPYAVQ